MSRMAYDRLMNWQEGMAAPFSARATMPSRWMNVQRETRTGQMSSGAMSASASVREKRATMAPGLVGEQQVERRRRSE